MKFRLTALTGAVPATIVSSIVLATAAVAGPRYSAPGVTIVRNADGSGNVVGTLGGARNSASPIEKLSCSVSRTAVTNAAGQEVRSTSVVCSATDVNGATAACSSNKESYADTLSGLSNDGLVDFSFNAAGACTALHVYESSSLERKR